MNNIVIGENLEIAPHLRAMLQHSFDSLQKLLTPDEMERLTEHVRKVQAINQYNYILKISSIIQETRLLHFKEKLLKKTTQNLNQMFFSHEKAYSVLLLDLAKHIDARISESDKLKNNAVKNKIKTALENRMEHSIKCLEIMNKKFERELNNRINLLI